MNRVPPPKTISPLPTRLCVCVCLCMCVCKCLDLCFVCRWILCTSTNEGERQPHFGPEGRFLGKPLRNVVALVGTFFLVRTSHRAGRGFGDVNLGLRDLVRKFKGPLSTHRVDARPECTLDVRSLWTERVHLGRCAQR